MTVKKKKTGVIIIIIVIVVAAIVIGGYFIWQNSQPKSGFVVDRMAQDGFLEDKTQEEIQALLDQVVEEGRFNVSINSNPVFENGASEGNLRIENVPGNRYYMKVIVVLDDTGETVYESDGLKQGQYIENVKLSKTLPKGEYPATAMFTAINPDTLSEEGAAEVKINIVVLG